MSSAALEWLERDYDEWFAGTYAVREHEGLRFTRYHPRDSRGADAGGSTCAPAMITLKFDPPRPSKAYVWSAGDVIP